MDDQDNSPEETVFGAAPLKDYPITRDSNFVRITADNTVVNDRGSELQISFIVHGPDPVKQIVRTDETGLRVTPHNVELEISYAEVARVRIGQVPAIAMAVGILERALASGNMDVPAMRAGLLEILDSYADTDASDDNEEIIS